MKTHPMLFNTDMVKALLAGNKLQTRLLINHDCDISRICGIQYDGKNDEWFFWLDNHESSSDSFNPKWRTGDLIYVRETYAIKLAMEYGEAGDPVYKADGFYTPKKWIPSACMPREHSRLTLKVTGVRVERVQQIATEDCIAEGCSGGHGSIPDYNYSATPKEHFVHAWKQRYGSSWQRNDWVWVIDFEVINQNVDHYLAAQESPA